VTYRCSEHFVASMNMSSDTKEGTKFRVIMEHEEKFFFCFWNFVNAQELLEFTTKLPVKLNDPVIDAGT
jgi:hypothetical protein